MAYGKKYPFQRQYFYTFKEPRNRFRQPKYSLWGLCDKYIPTRFLAPIDCSKIPGLELSKNHVFLEMCWMSFSHTQHKSTTILKSSVSSHGIDVSKYPFHNKIDFSQGIVSVESMPGIIKSLKIRALASHWVLIWPSPCPMTMH
jgi:hypothetical protein